MSYDWKIPQELTELHFGRIKSIERRDLSKKDFLIEMNKELKAFNDMTLAIVNYKNL